MNRGLRLGSVVLREVYPTSLTQRLELGSKRFHGPDHGVKLGRVELVLSHGRDSSLEHITNTDSDLDG